MNHFYNKIPGYFNYLNVYQKVIKEVPDNAHFVEIGVWQGKSVCCLAVEIIKSGKTIQVDAIDTFEGSPNEPKIQQDLRELEEKGKTLKQCFLENIEPVKHIVTPIQSDSVKAAELYKNNSIDFVFIDGSHIYENVRNDILAWLPKIKSGGYIGGHDLDGPEEFNGVRQAVDEIFGAKNIEEFNPNWKSWLTQV